MLKEMERVLLPVVNANTIPTTATEATVMVNVAEIVKDNVVEHPAVAAADHVDSYDIPTATLLVSIFHWAIIEFLPKN